MKLHKYYSYLSEDISSKLKVILLLRVVFINFILGLVIYFLYRFGTFPSIKLILLLIVITYILAICYGLIYSRVKDMVIFSYIQIILDLFIDTGIIYATGGIESIFSFLYIISIITASIILYRSGSYIIASTASILYGLILNLQYYGIIFPPSFFQTKQYYYDGSYYLYNIVLNIAAFYITAFLSGYLAERLKKTGEELKVKHSNLIELKAFHENIVKSMSSGLLTTDMVGKITSFNLAAEDITGYTFDDVKGKYFYNLFLWNKAKALFNNLPNIGKLPLRCEGVFIRKDKKDIYIGMSISLLRDENELVKGIICTFQDLTEMKIMEEKVGRAEKLAAIGEITAAIAHEIRNPLSSLSGSIQLLQKELDLKDTNRKLMDIVLNETERLNSTITQFLNYASPKPPDIHPHLLKNILEETIILLKNCLDYHKGITISTQYEDENMVIYADQGLIKEVFWNLCLNSLQAMPHGGALTISAYINKENRINSKKIYIKFRDTGMGIPKESLPKIFEPFYSTKQGGSGLGLATVYRIIEKHGGSITVDSEAEKGTTTLISLPLSTIS